MSDLSKLSIQSLRFRQKLGRWIVRAVRKWGAELEIQRQYREQLRDITAELQRRRKARREVAGPDKPPAQTIQLKAASMGADMTQPDRGIRLDDILNRIQEADYGAG